MKNINIYVRRITERRQKGFFQEVSEVVIKKDLTIKKAEEQLEELNRNKRVLFTLKRYDLTKKKDQVEFIKYIISDDIDIKRNYLLSDLQNKVFDFVKNIELFN